MTTLRRTATTPLLENVYDELRELAARKLQREREGHTLQATALVHEAYLRLADPATGQWRGREHLLAMAAEAIRHVLVDHARRKQSQKRGGDLRRITLRDDQAILAGGGSIDLLALDEALHRLRRIGERTARVVELRFFGGLELVEVARFLGVSARTVERDWRVARAWLRRELGDRKAS